MICPCVIPWAARKLFIQLPLFLLFTMLGFSMGPNFKKIRGCSKRDFIIVFPHTSRWDAFLMGLLNIAFDLNCCFGVAEMYTEMIGVGTLLRWAGAIPISNQAPNFPPQQTCQRVSAYLNEHPEKVFLLSPEGTIRLSPWKSGFLTISYLTQRPIIVGGINYQNQTVDILDYDKYAIPPPTSIPSVESQECNEIKEKCRQLMSESQFYPLYPLQSNPFILGSKTVNLHFVNWSLVTAVLLFFCFSNSAMHYLIYGSNMVCSWNLTKTPDNYTEMLQSTPRWVVCCYLIVCMINYIHLMCSAFSWGELGLQLSHIIFFVLMHMNYFFLLSYVHTPVSHRTKVT